MGRRRWTTTVASDQQPGLVPIAGGKVQIPPRFTSTGYLTEGDPVVQIDMEVSGGELRCRRVQITAVDGSRGVQAADLRTLRLDNLIMRMVGSVGFTVNGTATGGVQNWTPGGPAAAKVVASGRKRQPRKLTTEVLAHIAELYRQNAPSGKPVAAIAAQFGVSDRSARVYVQRAREAGLLGPALVGRAGEATRGTP